MTLYVLKMASKLTAGIIPLEIYTIAKNKSFTSKEPWIKIFAVFVAFTMSTSSTKFSFQSSSTSAVTSLLSSLPHSWVTVCFLVRLSLWRPYDAGWAPEGIPARS